MEESLFKNQGSITNFDEVLGMLSTYISKKEDIDFITRAFNYANEKHAGQVRKSGEPYINHCLSVAYILATYQSAPATIAAGFLHDTLEDCGVSYQEIKTLFNDDVAEIVQAVTKIKNLPNVSLEETSASTHRKLILAMAKDIRAVIVKLCDRLHNMRTLQYVKPHKQIETSKETLEVYAPLAHRLGMSNLKNELENRRSEIKNPTCGIGHIRWATHGSPSLVNAHPHSCTCGKLVVVHNGIIENYKELKDELTSKGCVFKSQTDTETIAHLVADEYSVVKNLEKAVRNSVSKLQGAYAVCVMHKDVPDLIIGARKHAPMLVGVGESENFIASDTPAIIEYTKKTIYLEDNEIAVVTKDSVKVKDIDGNILTKKVETLPWEPMALSKLGYKHFMLKEIHEQPDVIRNVLNGKLYDIDEPICLNEVKLDKDTIKNLKKITKVRKLWGFL